VVSLNALEPGQGIGTALLAAVEAVAHQAGCQRLWLVTTNDNLDALAFYQKRGFRLLRVDGGAADRARRIKPQIPTVGEHGIPLHDEIELGKILA
jgi:N-acetylglutamate synthase-like GNAT family acetyltransferase